MFFFFFIGGVEAADKPTCATVGGKCSSVSTCSGTLVDSSYVSDCGVQSCCVGGSTNLNTSSTTALDNSKTTTVVNVCADAGGMADEVCMPLEASSKSSTGYYSPTGYDCAMRGVCAGKDTGCCKPDPSATSPKAAAAAVSSAAGNAGVGTSFTNPLTYNNVEELLTGLLGAIQKIVVLLALVFIAIGSVMILASAGSSGMVEQGKKAITMALVGLALGVAAPSLLKELSIIIGWLPGQGGEGLTLSQIAVNVLNFLLGTMGIVALVMMIIGAILYLTSAGDGDRIDKGKEIFKYAAIGLLLAMASMIIVKQIAVFFQ